MKRTGIQDAMYRKRSRWLTGPRRALGVIMLLLAGAAIASVLHESCLAQAKTAKPSAKAAAPLPPEQRRLIDAQIANERAQADYYRKQNAKLSEKPKPQSFRQKVSDNPTALVGMIGAFVAAIVALITFSFNYRATLRNQRDTQFYEALKRFGDTDNPAVRCSAAGLLARMTALGSYGDRAIVINQLFTGILLERDKVVLRSIGDTIRSLIDYCPIRIFSFARANNLLLQVELVSALDDFVSPGDRLGISYLNRAAQVTAFDANVLRNLLNLRGTGVKCCVRIPSSGQNSMQTVPNDGSAAELHSALNTAALRLRTNVEVFAHALRESRIFWLHKSRWGIFAILMAGIMGNIDAVLRQVWSGWDISGVFLVAADLRETNLKGVNMGFVQLEDVRLAGAVIDEKTNLKGANWWMADFSYENTVDEDLLEKLYARYAAAVPDDLSKVHPSVRQFIEKKRQDEQSKNDSIKTRGTKHAGKPEDKEIRSGDV